MDFTPNNYAGLRLWLLKSFKSRDFQHSHSDQKKETNETRSHFLWLINRLWKANGKSLMDATNMHVVCSSCRVSSKFGPVGKKQPLNIKEYKTRRLKEEAAAHDARFAILTVDTKWAVILHSFALLSPAHVANQYAGRGFIARSIRQLSEMADRILDPRRQLPLTFPAIFLIFCHPGVISPHRPIKHLQRRFTKSPRQSCYESCFLLLEQFNSKPF